MRVALCLGAGNEGGSVRHESKGCQLVAVRANMLPMSASLHSPGHDGSAPLRLEAQTCPQTMQPRWVAFMQSAKWWRLRPVLALLHTKLLSLLAVNHKSIEHVSLPIIWMRRVCGCGGRKTRGRCLLLGPVRKGQLLLCDIIKCA
jgi:hypothetical protein